MGSDQITKFTNYWLSEVPLADAYSGRTLLFLMRFQLYIQVVLFIYIFPMKIAHPMPCKVLNGAAQ